MPLDANERIFAQVGRVNSKARAAIRRNAWVTPQEIEKVFTKVDLANAKAMRALYDPRVPKKKRKPPAGH